MTRCVSGANCKVDRVVKCGVGDSKAIAEGDLDVNVLELVVDLEPTAVDEDGLKANTGEDDDVIDDGGLEGLGFGSGAVVDDNDLASKLLDEGE
ncbi:hypothetical protein Pyn_09020 [Prunus yedoensis var. nudiflora]|uniref:Uncharacterized protein n=1 Tax=Prunus yedoensis var. nudiflora TaxID=2094558 RepID=A0A314UUV8_PRUYE|nr:hypothetical protein Pyn_09020 [Prunus yedoensis var. nudiflora]